MLKNIRNPDKINNTKKITKQPPKTGVKNAPIKSKNKNVDINSK